MHRKQFLKHGTIIVGGLVINPLPIIASNFTDFNIENKFTSKRPDLNQRTFVSKQVELVIQNMKNRFNSFTGSVVLALALIAYRGLF